MWVACSVGTSVGPIRQHRNIVVATLVFIESNHISKFYFHFIHLFIRPFPVVNILRPKVRLLNPIIALPLVIPKLVLFFQIKQFVSVTQVLSAHHEDV